MPYLDHNSDQLWNRFMLLFSLVHRYQCTAHQGSIWNHLDTVIQVKSGIYQPSFIISSNLWKVINLCLQHPTSKLQNSKTQADKHCLVSDQCDISGSLSAYETLLLPLKYPGVYILVLYVRALYKVTNTCFSHHCLANRNTIGCVPCSDTISFHFTFKNNMPSSPIT